MDIYGAQKNIEKLLKYVQNLADTKPTIYNKSKDRLKDLASTCNQIVELISEILQEEILTDERSEFTETNSGVIHMLDNMETQIRQLRRFAGADFNSTYDVEDNITTVTNKSSAGKRQVMQEYKSCLHKLADEDYSCKEASECANLLWEWFNIRFIKTAPGSNFKYNMKRFPAWLRDIVILYGYAVHTNDISNFMKDFHDWFELIATTDARDKFSIPYSVYQFNRAPDCNKMTLEAVVIWDMLIDKGLSSICKQHDEFYVTPSMVYDMCGDISPDCLNDYSDFRDHPEIIDKLRLTRKEDQNV